MHRLLVVVEELTDHIASRCHKQYIRSNRWNRLSAANYRHLARGTAFLALAEFYGPDDLPDALSDEVKQLGCRLLDRELTGPDSAYYDWQRRNPGSPAFPSGRPRRCFRAELLERWTAYRESVEGPDVLETWPDALRAQLQQHLRPEYWQLLKARYLDEVPADQLIREIMASNPTYQGANGYTKARSVLHVRLLRARRAAQAVLGPVFETRAQESAA